MYSVAYSHDGKRIASGGEDIVNVWDPASGQWRQGRSGHLDSITSVAFWPKRNRMASGSFDKRIVFYSFAYKDNLPRRFLKGHSDKVTSLAFSPDGQQIVSGGWDKLAILWSTSSTKKIRSFYGHRGPVLCVAFSPDGKLIATASSDKTLKIWGLNHKNALVTSRGTRII